MAALVLFVSFAVLGFCALVSDPRGTGRTYFTVAAAFVLVLLALTPLG